jgi:hypothetical protein
MVLLRFRVDYRSALSKVPGSIDTGLDDSFDVDIEERLKLRSQLRQRESSLCQRSRFSLQIINYYFFIL